MSCCARLGLDAIVQHQGCVGAAGHPKDYVICLQMKEADKNGKNGKRKGRGDADDGDEIGRKFFKKKY